MLINEAVILSKHSLDISSIAALAHDLANRLNINIEFGKFDFKNDKLIVLDSIISNHNEPIYSLFPQNNHTPDEVHYVLELGDEAKLIYKNILSLMLPFQLEYEDLYQEHISNPDGLNDNDYLKTSINKLQKLGAQEVYFIGDYNTAQSGINHNDEKNYTWLEFTEIIHKHFNHFIEPKQLIVNR